MRSAGKAMAQAGHAALMCLELLGGSYQAQFEQWAERGRPGVVLVADGAQWEQLKRDADCVAVRDAGLTQVEPGTETVLCLPPASGMTHTLPRLS